MNMRDDSLQLCAEGFYGLSPTLYRPRAVSFGFMHRGGRKCLSSSLPTPLRGYCYAVRQAERRDSQTSVWHGTTFQHGSIFTSGPTPENPPKHYYV